MTSRASTRAPKATPKAQLAPEPVKEPQKEPAKPSDPPKPADPKQLRERLAVVERERDDSTAQIAELKRKIIDFEKRGKDTTALSEQLAKEQKEKEELHAQIRALKRESSPEFKDRYEKPFSQHAEFAKRFVEQLTVIDEAGQPMRQAKWDDFIELYRLPYGKAYEAAKRLFGDAASSVMQHWNDLQKLDFQRSEALKEEQARWQEREKEDAAKQVQQREFIDKNWARLNKDISERHPEFFMDDPNDKDGNALLAEGFALVDAQPSSLEEHMLKDAHVRLQAAAFPRLVHRITKLQEQLEEKDAIIAELRGSAPGKTQRPSSATATTPATKDWKSDLRDTMGPQS